MTTYVTRPFSECQHGCRRSCGIAGVDEVAYKEAKWFSHHPNDRIGSSTKLNNPIESRQTDEPETLEQDLFQVLKILVSTKIFEISFECYNGWSK